MDMDIDMDMNMDTDKDTEMDICRTSKLGRNYAKIRIYMQIDIVIKSLLEIILCKVGIIRKTRKFTVITNRRNNVTTLQIRLKRRREGPELPSFDLHE
jgi:hypothetical protein